MRGKSNIEFRMLARKRGCNDFFSFGPTGTRTLCGHAPFIIVCQGSADLSSCVIERGMMMTYGWRRIRLDRSLTLMRQRSAWLKKEKRKQMFTVILYRQSRRKECNTNRSNFKNGAIIQTFIFYVVRKKIHE